MRKKDDKNGKHKILCITNTEDVSGMPLCEQGKQLGGRVDLVGPGVGVYVSVIWQVVGGNIDIVSVHCDSMFWAVFLKKKMW